MYVSVCVRALNETEWSGDTAAPFSLSPTEIEF